MKTLLKITAAIIGLIFVLIIGLNLYFTDDRLKAMVMPHVDEAVGREVQVESLAITFFRTFPRPGLSINRMRIPGETEQDTLMSLEQLIVGVEVFSLLGDEIRISEINLTRPHFTYIVHEDSTTNIDFLLGEETEEDTTGEGYTIDIPYFEITGGKFGYEDLTSNTSVTFNDFNANIMLRYADLISSTIQVELGGLSASANGNSYISNLPLSLSQVSTIDLEQETVKLDEGTFSIRGLALNLSGTISDWSNTLSTDLALSSSSDNFGELLRLIPEEYEEYTQGLETNGALSIDGNFNGSLAGEQIPAFDFTLSVSDGYLRNPDLPEPIENIQLGAHLSNNVFTIEQLTATAGDNNFSGMAELSNPLEESGTFKLDTSGNVDLSTVSGFIDISEFGLQQLAGTLNLTATASGNRNALEEATFDAAFTLTNGLLKYTDVPRSIENISIDASGTQEQTTINSFSLNAAGNTFSMDGSIRQLLDESNRTVDLETDLRFDLATIKDFYPISEDTLSMSGMLTAQATLQGAADQIEQSVQTGSINLKNGYINYAKLDKPFEDITFESVLEGNRLTIIEARFNTGRNRMSTTGLITNYLREDPDINLQLEGFTDLAEIPSYYNLEPAISELTGSAEIDLQVDGTVNNPAEMDFNGNMTISNMIMRGDSLVQPIENLNGNLALTPSSADLSSLTFNLGSSDINLSGSLSDYMEYLKLEEDRTTTPHLSGSYKSQYLNVDELIDWEDTTESEPIPIHLPNLNSSVTAGIDRMLITGVNMQHLQARASTTPENIVLEEASVELFEGRATGSFVWNVPDPERTNIIFEGSLDSLRAESFFEEYSIMGENSRFHEYVTGSFSANVNYTSELDEFLTPVIETTEMSGSFGMTKSRLQGHPVQNRIAGFLKIDELRNMVLDQWESTFTVSNSVLTFEDLSLTSGDIGAELSGTHHLVNDNINFDMRVLLPGRFKNAIASVITEQATNALERDNGTIMVPLKITGTSENPKVGPNEEVIKPIIQQYLKNKAGNTLRKLFDGGN